MINNSLINGFTINSNGDDGVGRISLYLTQTVFDVGQATTDIEVIVADIGEAVVSFDQTVFDAGEATVDFAIRVLHGGEASVEFEERVFLEGSTLAYIKEVVLAPGEATIDFEIQVTNPTGEATVDLEQTVFDVSTGAVAYFLESVVDGSLPVATAAPVWSLQVIVTRNDSVIEDITNKLVGQLTVEVEEGSARVATLYFIPTLSPSSASVYDYIGAQITIDCLLTDDTGTVTSVYRVFTGEVDDPEYDIAEDILVLNCTDNLQSRFEGRTKEEIDTMLSSGFWSSYLFSETESMWEYAQNLVSTMPYSVDLDVYASGIRVTAWDTENTTANYTFDGTIIDYGSVDLELAGKRDLRNTLNLEAEFRYPRLKLRKRNIGWDYGRNWCAYLAKPFPLPSKDMITQAAEGTGWPVESIWFDVRPMSGTYSCPSGMRIWVNTTPKADEQYCVGFLAKLQKRWTQSITERYVVTMIADASISTVGEVSFEDTLSVQLEADSSEWDNSLDNDEDLNAFANRMRIVSVGDDTNVDPFAVPSSAYQQDNGDWAVDWDDYPDEGNYDDFSYAFEAVYNQARTSMRAAHRENYVRFSLPINPILDTVHTVATNMPQVISKGKVHQLTHMFDIDTGEATTSVVLAISIGFSGVDNEVAFSMPDRPNTDFSAVAESPDTPPHLTQVGGESSSPAFIEETNGWSTNFDSAFGQDPTLPEERYYPTRFQASTPEVEDEATGPVDAQVDESMRSIYNIYIPNDVFTIYSYDEVP